MLPLILTLRRVSFKNISIAVLVILVFSTLSYIKIQTIERQKAELAYAHPKTVEKTRVVTVKGPVRIVTRIVERVGEKETTIDETRGPDLETTESLTESTPIPLDEILAGTKSNRWLLGVGLDNFSPGSLSSYRVYGGYSIRNRLDLCLGAQYDSRVIPSVLVMTRF